ncbi:MAG: DUF4349 domain-containing protein [Myxococcota bacterium]
MKTSFSLACVCALVGLVGCKKSAPTSAPSEYFEESYAADEYDYGGDMDDAMVEAEAAPSIAMERSSRARRERGGLFRKADKAVLGSAPPSEPAPEPSVAPADGATKADERPPEVDDARHIIYTAGMRVAVFNVADALATAEGMPERFGGYVQSMSDSAIVLRLPSASLREAMKSLGGYGNVEQKWLRSQDVTAEFTDLQSRLKALTETQTQLLALLDDARTVEEALKVRQALDEVTSELEVLKGRLRQLDNMTTYSTLTLEFYERGPHNPTPSSNDPFPWVDGLGVEDTEWK